ncbi:MAG: RNA polymerase sigma factor [Sphingomonas sp.]|nr:RNA polymerase sigma factor [Sphingomonas sp.]MBV9527343.1 RNA polymerase sigma factor [Sphingomonas sp.]
MASAQGGSSPTDDAWLVAAIARGDATAFRQLVDRRAPMLHRLAYHMLGDRSEAEDVTQECFLRLWDHAAGWRPQGGGLPGWLRRVATNLCLDRLRRSRRMSSDAVPERSDDRPGADAVLDADRLARLAQRAVLALPDRQRAAIVLTYYEELGNIAAAEALQMNIKAFESLLFRARAALRERLRTAGVRPQDVGGGK